MIVLPFRHSAEILFYGPEDASQRRSVVPLDAPLIDKVYLGFTFQGGSVHPITEESVDITLLWRANPAAAQHLCDVVALMMRNAEETGRRSIQFGLRDLLGAARNTEG